MASVRSVYPHPLTVPALSAFLDGPLEPGQSVDIPDELAAEFAWPESRFEVTVTAALEVEHAE